MNALLSGRRLLVVACGIIWRGNRFLGACRPRGKPHAGKWEFPGGKVEPGESPARALVRELREELSVSVRCPMFWRKVRHVYPESIVELHFFQVTEFDGEPLPNDGQELRWLTPEEACTLPFLEPDKPLLSDSAFLARSATLS